MPWKFDPGLVKEARYHKCNVCRAVVLCDWRCIGQHVALVHSMPIKRYVELAVGEDHSGAGGEKRKRKATT